MSPPRSAPFGSWLSPISADLITSGTVGLEQVVLDGEDTYWLEGRPAEGGRYVIVRRTLDGRISDCLPPPFNARTRVHEYGGSSYLVRDRTVYFSNFTDQRLYRQEVEGVPEPITPPGDQRFADAYFDAQRNRLVCVQEDHSTGKEPRKIGSRP